MPGDARASSRGTRQAPAAAPADSEAPVVMGRVTGPYGVLGWVKVATFTEHVDTLLDFDRWLVGREDEGWREVVVEEGRLQGDHVVARLSGMRDRDEAFRMKGLEVAVPRTALPAPEGDEMYWADLVGFTVVNGQDERLGAVAEVFSNGSHPILRVREEGAAERLIPFVAAYVQETDVGARLIRVDWSREW